MQTFGSQGYARTTVADIVAGTDYSSGAFYHHFANKAECLWAVIDYRRDIRKSWADLATELDPAGTTLDELVAEAFARLSSTLEGTHAWTMVMVEYYRAHGDEPGVDGRLAELYEQWIEEVAVFVRFLQANDLVDRERDATTVASQVVAFAEGYATHAMVHGIDPSHYPAALADGTLRLLRTEHR